MKNKKLKKTASSAVLSALCCIATIVIQIPSPMNGYINMGDAAVLLCAFTLPAPYAAAAAGIGSGIADILTGFVYYSAGTVIIKALMAASASLLFHKIRYKNEFVSLLFSGIVCELIMIIGYTVYASIFLGSGFAAAATSVPGNLVQAAVGIIGGILIYTLLPKKIKHNI